MPEIYPTPIGFDHYSERVEQRLGFDELLYREQDEPLEVVLQLDPASHVKDGYRLFAEVHHVVKFDPVLRQRSAVLSLDPHDEQDLTGMSYWEAEPALQGYGVEMQLMNRQPAADEPLIVGFKHDFLNINYCQAPLEINVEGQVIRAIGGYLLEADPNELMALIQERDAELAEDAIDTLTDEELEFMENVRLENEFVVGRHPVCGRYEQSTSNQSECG